MYYVFMLFYTFLHFKRRPFGTASFNVKRQLLLFADETPILWAFSMRKGVKIYKKIKKNCSDIKKIDFYKKIELLIFFIKSASVDVPAYSRVRQVCASN